MWRDVEAVKVESSKLSTISRASQLRNIKLGNRHPHVEALGVHAGEGPSNTTITILYLKVMKPFNLEF